MALKVFIDANIFLNFFAFHDEDLDQLKKLVEAVNKEEITLFITTQVIDEVARNRDGVVADAYKKFKDSRTTLDMPVMCKTYPEYAQIKNIQGKLEKAKSELSAKLWTDIVGRSLRADEVIKNLIAVASVLDSNKYLSEAVLRRQRGNPPGKKSDHHGDEINWETLLAEIPKKEEFIIISEDSDFQSPLSGDEINSFLKAEWLKRKRSEIFYYRSLTSFFNQHNIKIHLRWEEEKNSLISDLVNSPNFSSTHDIVRRLSKFNSFSDEQIKGIGTAALSNNQVSWICKDEDVENFYQATLAGKSDLFDATSWDELQKMFFTSEEEETAEAVKSVASSPQE